MKNIKIIQVLSILLVFSTWVLTGCYKDVTLPKVEEVVTTPVSYSSDLQPIWNAKCATSGCHNAGGKAPNLTAGNSYNALKAGGYINTANPSQSELYLWMTGKRGTPMPLSGPVPADNALVLAWIQQGALNN